MYFIGGFLTKEEEKVAEENNISSTTHIICRIEDLYELELQQYEWVNYLDDEAVWNMTIEEVIELGNENFDIDTKFLSDELIAIPKKTVKANVNDILSYYDLYPRQEVYIEQIHL